MEKAELPTLVASAESAPYKRVNHTEQRERPTEQRRKKWSTTTKVLSAALAIIGAVTGVVSVVQILTRDTSSVDTLHLTAKVADAGTQEFALPLSDIDSDFPAATEACGTEQLAWLKHHAISLDRRLRIDMRNNASEGAMLALVDFRADVKTETSASPTHVLVTCPSVSPSNSARAAGLSVDDLDSTARFRALKNSQISAAPDIPVTWNLAPGENGVIDIEISSERGITGSLVVTTLSGRNESVVPIQGSHFDLPGLWRHGESYFSVGTSGFECSVAAGRDIVPCGVADWAELTKLRDSIYSTG